MELRDFAEQVLFATTLEEKLQCPQNLTDERPGSAILAPAEPGRPVALRFKNQESAKREFPGVQALEQESERGRLLHFFANHELLATELMALVLLRFPDAPAAFRRGVLQTLKDEQEHTRLYMQRMLEGGVEFGELPVSGYFWRCIATMENPIDYVAGLSLTFEQANLDFARHFAQGFTHVGDQATAELLERIHRDEITHVAYGLKWFRRWKNPDQSDWEAFCRQLKFPLSPQRAKGIALNVEARRAAGFDPQFIAELNVYSQSKGRTPSVFVFNPFAEAYIAQGRAFTPIKHQVQLARDLANLPQFLCRQDDIVLVPQRPSVEFLSGIKQAGFALPEFVELTGGSVRVLPIHRSGATVPVASPAVPATRVPASVSLVASGGTTTGTVVDTIASETLAPLALAQRKIGRLRPWAWGPDCAELLARLFSSVTGEQRLSEQRFNERIAGLYSKAWSADLLRQLLVSVGPEDWLCTREEVGVAVTTPGQASAVIEAIRRKGHHKIVVKEALGLAGSNAIRLWEPEVIDAHRRWISGALEKGRQLVIEPWLERELDFSVQLEMTGRGLKLCGYTGLINDRKGQFQANWAAPNFARRIPGAIPALFPEPPDITNRLHQLYAELFTLLEARLKDVDFIGPISIDAFVYRAADGRCRLKPVVEINPRYTMGRVTVELMSQACPGTHGVFRLVNHAMLRRLGHADFAAYARALREQHPLRLEGEPVPRIRSGALCLNDPATAQVCLAVFRVGDDANLLRGDGAVDGKDVD